MGVLRNLEGQVFGKLTVVGDSGARQGRNVLWDCLCECGVAVKVRSSHLLDGNTKSCGCLKGVNHGLRSHDLYPRWQNMINRCYNSSSKNFKDYGGRGLTICDEWRCSPANYIEWCESNGYASDLQVDRIDNDSGYSPDNCRFVTAEENNHNRRRRRDNSTGYTGVFYRGDNQYYAWKLTSSGKKYYKGCFKTAKEASDDRDSFINIHGFKHKLNTPHTEEVTNG